MNRTQKAEAVGALGEKLKKAQIMVVAEYTGLKVSELTSLRKALRKNDGEFRVVKNRLAQRAVKGTELEAITSYLKGSTALVFGPGDPVLLSKTLAKYAEDLEPLKIKGGYFSGKILQAKDVEALAKLPSREELYAKLLGTLLAPANNLVRVLNALPQKVVTVLGAIKDKKS